MKLWTIQPLAVWDMLQEQGHYTASFSYVDEYDRLPYCWLMVQMHIRLGYRPSWTGAPIWAWYQYDGPKRMRPDLRSSAHLRRGTKGVRLELAVSENTALLSDFMLWHGPLNHGYLGETDEDAEQFYEEVDHLTHDQMLDDPVLRTRILKSWHRIFDLDWSDEKLHVQATFWELTLPMVKDVTYFTAR